MVNQQLIDWIRGQESQNHTPQEISAFLIQKGYNPNDVNEALNILSQKQPQPLQQNSPKKTKSFLPIVIIGIVIIAALIGGGIFWFTSQNQNPKELYVEYLDKQKDAQTYSIVYSLNMPSLGMIGNSVSMKMGIFKNGIKKKTVVEVNAMGETNTVSSYNLSGREIMCMKSGVGLGSNEEFTCDTTNSLQEMSQFATVNQINTDETILDKINVTYEGTDTINKVKCALFHITIDDLNQLTNITDTLASGYNQASSKTPGTMDICLEKKTGLPLHMNISAISRSELSNKNVANTMMELTMESFSEIASEDNFVMPINFSIKESSCNDQDIVILLDPYADINGQLTVNILESNYYGKNKNVLKSLPIKGSLNANTPKLIMEKHGQSSSDLSFEVCADTECHTGSCYSSDDCLQYSLNQTDCEYKKCLFKDGVCKTLNCYDLDTKDQCETQFKCNWSAYSESSGYCMNKDCSEMTNANDCAMLTGCLWSGYNCVSQYLYQQSVDDAACNNMQADTSDTTPRIAYWYGKIDQHTEDGVWKTDPDGISGADLDMLTYCKKWYNDTTSVIPYKNETIGSFKDAGNTGCYETIRPSYECRNY